MIFDLREDKTSEGRKIRFNEINLYTNNRMEDWRKITVTLTPEERKLRRRNYEREYYSTEENKEKRRKNQRKYHSTEENKEKHRKNQRKYIDNQEVKERKKAYSKEYIKRPDVIARMQTEEYLEKIRAKEKDRYHKRKALKKEAKNES